MSSKTDCRGGAVVIFASRRSGFKIGYGLAALQRRSVRPAGVNQEALANGVTAPPTAAPTSAPPWIAAQTLRLIYAAGDRAQAEQRLHQYQVWDRRQDQPLTRRIRRIRAQAEKSPIIGLAHAPPSTGSAPASAGMTGSTTSP